MSDDIVARLREAERDAKKDSREEMLFVDAADEIERLRAELAAERVQHKSVHEMLCKEVDDLEAERDALRALLREARNWMQKCGFYGDGSIAARIDAALKGDGDD